jgi:flagellar assembly factor FliW
MSALAKRHVTPQPAQATVMIQTQMFGTVEIPQDQLLTMPDGLFGFEQCQGFALLPTGRDGFFWLQSTDHSTVTFLVCDPFVYFDGYTVDLNGQLLQRLDTNDPASVNVYCIVTLPGANEDATVNLQGPVVFNVAKRQGFQAVLQDSEFGTRERIARERLN